MEKNANRMKVLMLFTLVAFISAHKVQCEGTTYATATIGEPWPLPQTYLKQDAYFTIDPSNFRFLLKSDECDVLVDALKRYKNLTFIDSCSILPNQKEKMYKTYKERYIHNSVLYSGQLQNLTIQYKYCEKYPHEDMDEQYHLDVNSNTFPGQAVLLGNSPWGILRGLETFSQLVYRLESGEFIINSTSIQDFPRFSFRGFLLDTSRHYLSVPIILQNLDLMAQSKLNVFHWHIVDDVSFPFVSKSFPKLHEYGAFNTETHIYNAKDVENVIEYARLRGIRVLVEFDTPGHTLSWGKSQKSLLSVCYKDGFIIPDRFGPIDPTNDSNYVFLKTLFTEIASVFPDKYIHLGGDEVNTTCWAFNPTILKFMANKGLENSFPQLEGYFMQRLMKTLQPLKKKYVVWEETYDNGIQLNPNIVMHLWRYDDFGPGLQRITAAGFRAILSSCWYINHIEYGIDWYKFYKCDPHNFDGTDAQKRLVIGGEICMWGEYVDGANVISRSWPRASVAAERLWSARSVNSISEAGSRLEEHHCRLLKRGYRVGSVNGPGYCKCDYIL